MNHFHEEACESVDASVFSGDLLYTSLEEFKEYLGRWNRAVAEHEAALADETPKERAERLQDELDEADMPGGFPD